MSSFLQRLKQKDVIPANPEDKKQAKVDAQLKPAVPEGAKLAEQLQVDIYKTHNAILVYAQLAGTTISDYGVLIEGEGDIVTIKGQRTKPNGEFFQHHIDGEKEKVLEECSWGQFYRQIILPAAVDSGKTEAKMKDGVLMLLLPLKEMTEQGVKIQVQQV